MEKNSSQNKNKKEENFDEILAKESPELLLKIKQYETEPHLSPSLISEPYKLFIFVLIFDGIVALLLSILKTKFHFVISAFEHLGHVTIIGIPWWLAFLDGIIFIGYGIYVIKRRKGEFDYGPTTHSLEVKEIGGESASMFGLIYVFLGIFLIVAVIVQCFIQGIF